MVLTLALSGSHWLRRPLHGSLHRSCVVAVYPTLELICEFRPSKFSHYTSRPATRSFCHYPTRSRPEVKNHYPSGPVEQTTREDRATQLSCATLQMLSSPNIWRFCELRCIAIHFVHRMNCDAQEFCKRIMKDYLA